MRYLARELIRRGTIRTTMVKAKAVQPLVEKLVTKAKKSSASAKIAMKKVLSDKATEKILLADAGTRFAARTSGFTRIVKLGPRAGDAAEEVLLQFVDEKILPKLPTSPRKRTSLKA